MLEICMDEKVNNSIYIWRKLEKRISLLTEGLEMNLHNYQSSLKNSMNSLMLNNVCRSLVAAVLFILITKLQAESQIINRNNSPTTQNHTLISFSENISITMDSAKEYLGKFGWIYPAEWTGLSPRLNESVPEGGKSTTRNETFSYRQQDETSFNRSTSEAELLLENRFNSFSPKEFKDALRKFQKAHRLAVTGTLDQNTISMMTQLRCGVPDQTKEWDRSNASLNNSNSTLSNLSYGNAFASSNKLDQSQNKNNFSSNKYPISPLVTSFPKLISNTNLVRQRRNSANLYVSGIILPPEVEESRQRISVRYVVSTMNISEAETSLHSRKESIEEALVALRNEKIDHKTTPNSKPSTKSNSRNLLSKVILHSRKTAIKNRRKRSRIYLFNSVKGWGLAFAKKTITWRLIKEWPSTNPFMSSREIWFTAKLAFRMWSEVLPRNFLEDNTSPVSDVDILIGFGKRRHNRCPVVFYEGPFAHEYAHAWPLPKAEVHFNDAQPFVPVTWKSSDHNNGYRRHISYRISLLKVAVHEIGHTLGLPHNKDRRSIMNAIYVPFQSGQDLELQSSDREGIKSIYGACELQFDAVFDWVQEFHLPKSGTHWKYNTFFFRNGWHWLYENRAFRPRYGDPKVTGDHWLGIMDYPTNLNKKIDSIVHIRERNSLRGPTYFFIGDTYIEYDNRENRAKTHDRYGRLYPRRIQDDFPGIPYPIDTVFYKWNEERLYFFQGETVYLYSWSKGRLTGREPISEAFPGWGGASPLPSNIDAAYYSYSDDAFYFFKNVYFWKLADTRERNLNKYTHIRYNSVGHRRKISSKWKDICDVGYSELVMHLNNS